MLKLCQILVLSTVAILFSWPPASITCVNAAKILGLFAHPSESHFTVMRSVMLELAKRQHNVTVYSSHRLADRIEHLEEIIIEPEYPFWSELQKVASIKDGGLNELSQLPAAKLQQALANVGATATNYFLSHVEMQKLLQLPADGKFDYDLIIVDLFYTEALLTLGYIHKTPTIGIVSTNFENYMQHVLESLLPIACSPIDFDTETGMGFFKRLANTRNCLDRRKQFAKSNLAAQQNLMEKHFGHMKADLPDVVELQANLAVLLLNNHVPLYKPRPLLHNTIAAGGLHIRPTRELPWHIKRFLDESRAGVIYMNLGNEQLCSEMPKEKLQTLLNVFNKRKQHLLWTCHDAEQMIELPKHIMLQHMVPQSDILAHPHVKVFVMNGDLMSLQEGILRHVPMLGIPIFRSETYNIDVAVQLGVAIKIASTNLTEQTLATTLDTLLTNASYPLAIRQVSTTFRDRPLGALETSMYWIDYVLRHNGGADIKTHGVASISTSQLHLLDLFLFYFALTLLIAAAVVGVFYVALYLFKRQHTSILYSKLK